MSLPTMHLEAVLFSAAKPISMEMLEEVFGLSRDEIQDYINELKRELEEQNRGIRLRVSGAGVELVSAIESADYVGHIRKREDKLSNAAMETLAVIAYKQPITKAEIEEIRGVAVSSHIMKTLLERDWVKVIGHRDVPGRPSLYATTRQFLDYFNLSSKDELPEINMNEEISEEEKDLFISKYKEK